MKKFLLILLLSLLWTLSAAQSNASLSSQQISQLFQIKKTSTKINSISPPAPARYLLLQPLMTIGIENYYQRTPIIRTIYAARNQAHSTYSRAIIMLIDSNKMRNNALFAQDKNEAKVVEIAFITMNFKALPRNIRAGVLHTSIPFGKLLRTNHLITTSKDRRYFSVICDKQYRALTGCPLNSTLYGRTNTLVRADNQTWLARVTEILPANN